MGKILQITHKLNPKTVLDSDIDVRHIENMTYIGRCKVNGEMFAGFASGEITIYIGYFIEEQVDLLNNNK